MGYLALGWVKLGVRVEDGVDVVAMVGHFLEASFETLEHRSSQLGKARAEIDNVFQDNEISRGEGVQEYEQTDITYLTVDVPGSLWRPMAASGASLGGSSNGSN